MPARWTIEELSGTVAALAQARPLFHSEADFQHAFAWQLHAAYPAARIRLETRTRPGERLDVFAVIDGRRIAVELKYLLRKLTATIDGELFNLPDHSAQDLRRYDFIKDIGRLERMRLDDLTDDAYAVALTNDPGYWRPTAHEGTVDAAFRLPEGRRLAGVLGWAAHTGAGTMAGRNDPIALGGDYLVTWHDYSLSATSATASCATWPLKCCRASPRWSAVRSTCVVEASPAIPDLFGDNDVLMPDWLPPLLVAALTILLLNLALLEQRRRTQRRSWEGRLLRELRAWDGRLPDELDRSRRSR